VGTKGGKTSKSKWGILEWSTGKPAFWDLKRGSFNGIKGPLKKKGRWGETL